MRIFLHILFLAWSASLLHTYSAHAATQAISVTPSTSEISLNPGESARKRITVSNKGDVVVSVTPTVSSYSVSKDYDPVFEPLPGYAPAQWLALDDGSMRQLGPRQYRDIMLTASIPAGTAAGGYSLAVITEAAPVGAAGATGISSKQRIAHIMYITVKGEVTRAGAVRLITPSFVSISPSQTLGYEATNSGGTNETIATKTEVYDAFGRNVKSDQIDRYVLPGTKRNLQTQWQRTSLFGVYKVEYSYTFLGKTQTKEVWTVYMHPVGVIALLGIVAFVSMLYVQTKKRKGHHA